MLEVAVDNRSQVDSTWFLVRKVNFRARLFPIVEQAPYQNNLAGMVGVVVTNQEGFPEKRLAGAVWERRKQVLGRVFEHTNKPVPVVLDLG